ncbi:MAG TPA: MerR family DNA-binding transcriptional regulator [Candidatus Nanoarchaeia archaeon]|nr:MerR family DNA-binding transcriptional regulator [Candidatus Nanoarchaeia archaeon]
MSTDFLTIKQAAKMLGVTALTLRNWDNSGKFTATRHPINNYRVYKKAEVDMLLEDMRTKQTKTKINKRQPFKIQIRHEE